jgi:hypothetical protein
MIFQIDHDRSSCDLWRRALWNEHRASRQGHNNGIRRLRTGGIGHIPHSNAVIFNDGLQRRLRAGLQ